VVIADEVSGEGSVHENWMILYCLSTVVTETNAFCAVLPYCPPDYYRATR